MILDNISPAAACSAMTLIFVIVIWLKITRLEDKINKYIDLKIEEME